MEGSSRGNGSSLPLSPWNSSPPRRSNPYFSFPDVTTSSTESSSPQRSLASRRRRILGRLARSGSDSRTMSNSSVSSDAPVFMPETLPTTPSKRKAPAYGRSGKQVQNASSLNSLNVSATDPPVIRSEDITSSAPSSSSSTTMTTVARPIARASPVPNLREFVDSSDEDMDMLELSMFNPIGQPNIQSVPLDFNNRNRIIEEAKKRQETGRMSSAILAFSERGWRQTTDLNGGTDRIKYLPLCPAQEVSARFEASNNAFLTVLPSHQNFTQRSEQVEPQHNATWPMNELPVELFDLITTHLARDDVKCMRLVNREFEQKVSRSLFHTCVVPFNTEIYDMIDEDRKNTSRTPVPRDKGKGKAKSLPHGGEDLPASDLGALQWQNAKEDKEGKVYKGHGLRVFRGFGPHIKHFGMSFEISEKQLSRPPLKNELDHIVSYYGSYDWPSMNYARFASLAGLENTADETSRMKAAFSNLQIVQELAISVDSGLGWLNGPDRSIHGLLFEQPTPVFGSSYTIPDHATQIATEFWNALRRSQYSFDPQSNLKEVSLEHRAIIGSPIDIEGLRGNIYSNTKLWSTIDRARISPRLNNGSSSFGVLYTTAVQQGSDNSPKFSLMPGDLSKEQKEWLLETQWAQQAFLESYMLAVIDNPTTFRNVSTLNIAKLSSRFLPMLARDVFWDALPHLSEVILKVSADWRYVEKDDAGFAQTMNKYPSEAARILHRDILQTRVASRKSIKKLTVGWVGGGEHAEGMFARNNNVLPAPITRPDHCTANSGLFGIVFEHVEHLTLSNCWLTPPVLEGLIKCHASKSLKKLTLDSVSLTAHPKFPNNAQGAAGQQLAQAVAAMQAQLNHAPAAAPPLQGNLHAQLQHAQLQHAQQLALMQQQFNQQWNQQINQQGNVNQNILAAGPFFQNVAMNANNLNTDGNTNAHWTTGHREGSWPQLINDLSPGPIFNDYLSAPAPWEEQLPPRSETNLRTIEFKSCGYAKLPNHGAFDQHVLEPTVTHRHNLSPWFRARMGTLKSAMMTTTDRNVGQIVQYMPWRELNALQFAWGLVEGWQDRAKAEEPEFDGFLLGGTGRFSGVVQRGMALVGQTSTS